VRWNAEQQQDNDRLRYVNEHLKKLYYDLDSTVSFSSIKNVTRSAAPYGIRPKEVKQWLLSQETYARHRPARRKFPLNFYNVHAIDDVWEIDICDYKSLAEFNDGFKYFVNIIDCLSRHVWAYALKSKSGKEVADTLQQHFEVTGRTCKLLQADHGREFTARVVQQLLRKHKVSFRTLENRGHAAVVEKANQRIKTTLHKFMTHQGTWKWVEALPKVVHGYNHTIHSATGFRPVDVTPFNAYDIWSENYLRKRLPPHHPLRRKRRNATLNDLHVGDHVRVSLVKTEFEKGYTARYSQQIYKISSIIRMKPFQMYTLTDLNGERLKGNFYHQELLKVLPPAPDTRFRVETVLKTRKQRGRRPEVLIRWEGYDKEFDSWEPASAITEI